MACIGVPLWGDRPRAVALRPFLRPPKGACGSTSSGSSACLGWRYPIFQIDDSRTAHRERPPGGRKVVLGDVGPKWALCYPPRCMTTTVEGTVMGRKHLGNTASRNRPYPVDVSCPSCASSDCIRADRRGWRDVLSQLAGKFPWKCRRCMHRFYLGTRSTA